MRLAIKECSNTFLLVVCDTKSSGCWQIRHLHIWRPSFISCHAQTLEQSTSTWELRVGYLWLLSTLSLCCWRFDYFQCTEKFASTESSRVGYFWKLFSKLLNLDRFAIWEKQFYLQSRRFKFSLFSLIFCSRRVYRSHHSETKSSGTEHISQPDFMFCCHV